MSLAQALCGVLLPPTAPDLESARLEEASGEGQALFAHLGDDISITVSGEPEPRLPRTVSIARDDDLRTVRLDETTVHCKGEWLATPTEGDWRFVRCIENDRGAAIQVVSAAGEKREVGLPFDWFQALLPVQGAEDEAVALAPDREIESLVTAHLLTSGSLRKLGSFPRSDSVIMGRARWQALRLDDERLAVISLQTEDLTERSLITLRVFSPSGDRVTTLPFPEGVEFHSIATAVDRPEGKLGVIALEPGGGLWSLTLGTGPEVSPLSSATKVTDEMISIPSPGLRMTAARGRFVAGWIREGDFDVRLCEFNEDLAYRPVTIGKSAGRHLLELRSIDDEIQVVWQSGRIVQRNLPFPMTGYVIANRILDHLKGEH